MLYYLLTALYVFVCLVLLLVILLQQGKGGDVANAFGGGGSSQAAFGARAGATLLSKLTAVFAALFMLGSLALAIMGQRGPSSVVGDPVPPPEAPAAPASTPAPAQSAPATPAPAPAPATPPAR